MSEKQPISSEQAFDMLPFVVDIYDKINFDKYRKDLQKKYKDKKNVDPLQVAIEASKYILKNTPKIKNEFFSIIAIAENRKVEEVKQQSLAKTISAIKQVFSDPELVDFFKEAMQ